MIILGAGMAGLLAAYINPKATIFEAADSPPNNHSAVLRFRTPNIGQITGMPFREVQVHKSVYFDNALHQSVTPLMANLYSRKVSGKIINRSIWNLDTVSRYIAPHDFNMQLLDMMGARINYGHKVLSIGQNSIATSQAPCIERIGQPIISTMPMPILAKAMGIEIGETFSFQAIKTERWKIANCDVFQTVYFPDPCISLYRASITGDELILESIINLERLDEEAPSVIAGDVFGLHYSDMQLLSKKEQTYGKIAPINDSKRKGFMFDASHQLGVYSLGRFACWRNILLDDVYNDIFKLRQMINQSPYDIIKEHS